MQKRRILIIIIFCVTTVAIIHFNFWQTLDWVYLKKSVLASSVCLNGTAGPVLTSYVPNGRLGNQMFMYATMYASLINEKQWTGVVSPIMNNFLTENFQISLPKINLDTYEKVNWADKNINWSSPRNRLPTASPCLRICCYPKQWALFHSYQSAIRNEFTFHPHILAASNQILTDACLHFFNSTRRKDITLIGVHVRRTDYIKHAKEILKLHIPELPFYRGAMKYMSGKYSNSVFVITSDDIGYCRQQFKDLETVHRIYYVDHGNSTGANVGVDLAVLAQADHVIYGVGTFGFWAGYLSFGEVVYCACVKKESILRDVHNFFLPSWTGITPSGFVTSTKYKVRKRIASARRQFP